MSEYTKEKLKQETIDARNELIEQGNDEDAIDAYIALGTGDYDLSDFEEAYCGFFVFALRISLIGRIPPAILPQPQPVIPS